MIGLLVGMSLFSMFFFISLYMQQVLGYGPLKAGFAYLPLALTIIVSAGVASQLVTRLGFKPVLIGGLTLVLAGLLWFTQVSPDGTYVADILGPSVVAGAGLGFSFVPVTIGAVSGTKPEEAGLASGLINTNQQVGGALGLGILSTIAFADVSPGSRDPAALTAGFSDAFLVAGLFALIGIVVALTVIRTADSRALQQSGVQPVAA